MIQKTQSKLPTATSTRSSQPSRSTARPDNKSRSSRPAGTDGVNISRDRSQAGPTPDFSGWSRQPQPWTQGETLRTGMKSDRVRALQQSLRDQGFQLKVDGKFGPETESMVKQYQSANKLVDDGLVGPKTFDSLSHKSAGGSPGRTTAQTAPDRTPGPSSGARPQAEAPSHPSAAANPSRQTSDRQRKPVDSFTFRSNPQDPGRVKRLIEDNRAQGKTTMVGIDPNNAPAAQKKLLQTARESGAKTHLYLEGRGGPTGKNGWEDSEWHRTKQAAANLKQPIHLTSQSDNHPAMKEWNDRGWQEHSIKQARQAKRDGFDSVEIDNINRLGSGDNTRRTMDFYRQYSQEYAKGDMPTLMMKNQTVEELRAVRSAVDNYNRTKDMTPEQLAQEPASVRNNRIPREMFSDYHIFENDGGDLQARHIELTQGLGIKLLQSRDTNNYGASGNFN